MDEACIQVVMEGEACSLVDMNKRETSIQKLHDLCWGGVNPVLLRWKT